MNARALKTIIRSIIIENMSGEPDIKKWWTYNPKEIMDFIYKKNGSMPPAMFPAEYEEKWNDIKTKLQAKFPPPTDPGVKLKEVDEKTPLVWIQAENNSGWYAKGFGPAFSMANVKESTPIRPSFGIPMYELKIKKNGRTYKKSNAKSLEEVNDIFKKMTGHEIKFEDSQIPIPAEPDLNVDIDPLLRQKGLIKKEDMREVHFPTGCNLDSSPLPADLEQYVTREPSNDMLETLKHETNDVLANSIIKKYGNKLPKDMKTLSRIIATEYVEYLKAAGFDDDAAKKKAISDIKHENFIADMIDKVYQLTNIKEDYNVEVEKGKQLYQPVDDKLKIDVDKFVKK